MKKILLSLLAVLIVVIVAIGVAITSFDINKHRGELESALSQKIGRAVKLGGDIHIGLSLSGLTLSIHDASLGNPSWASRPSMAGMGLFDLQLALWPLLSHQITINGLTIANADILLESAAGDRHNWVMQVETPQAAASPAAPPSSQSLPVSLNVTSLTVKDSQLGLRGEDGKITIFKVNNLMLVPDGTGMALHFDGSYNDLPIKLAVVTNADQLTSKAARPMDIDLAFANYHLTAKGKVDIGGAKADLDSYELSSGDTKLAGHLAATWGGARLTLRGTLTSDNLIPSDLKMVNAKTSDSAKPAPAPSPSAAPQRVFSDAPLGLEALKAADVDLDVSVAALPSGSVDVQNIKGRLAITNGHLLLAPLKMAIGAGTVNGQINLDASSSPAHFGTTFNIASVDLSDLIKVWGAEAFLSGKVNAELNLASTGNSLHELASNLSGPINMIGAGGDVITSSSSQLSAGISEILNPGSGNAHDGMNCLVARLIALNGVVKSHGILIDTAAATAAGYGDIDLRSETLNLDFYVKTKLVDLGSILPPVRARGTLAHPDVRADPKAIMQNMTQLLTGGSVTDPVPDLVTQQGQNACAYTLDHPSAATPAQASSKGGAVQNLAAKANTLLKGLFGK